MLLQLCLLALVGSLYYILLEMSAQALEFSILRSGITTVYIDRMEYTEIEILHLKDRS